MTMGSAFGITCFTAGKASLVEDFGLDPMEIPLKFIAGMSLYIFGIVFAPVSTQSHVPLQTWADTYHYHLRSIPLTSQSGWDDRSCTSCLCLSAGCSSSAQRFPQGLERCWCFVSSPDLLVVHAWFSSRVHSQICGVQKPPTHTMLSRALRPTLAPVLVCHTSCKVI